MIEKICGLFIPIFLFCQGLLRELVRNVDGELKAKITSLAAHHEHRLNLGSKAIYHLEAFVASFMAMYKAFLEENMAEMF